MIKKLFYILPIALFFCSLLSTSTRAQSDTPKFEIGGHFSLIRLRDLDTTDAGVGGRFGYNFSDAFGVEAELTSFPKDRLFEGGRKVQGLFGIKIGKRSEKAGIFAKFRPGFMYFSSNEITNPVPCTPNGLCLPITVPPILKEQTNFAFDMGGVLEFYPTRHLMARFDLGDTIIRFGERSLPAAQPFTSHNLQFNAGIGFRF